MVDDRIRKINDLIYQKQQEIDILLKKRWEAEHPDIPAPPTMLCNVEGCGRGCYAKGYCSMHWLRWHKHGDPNVKYPKRKVKVVAEHLSPSAPYPNDEHSGPQSSEHSSDN